jgi:hypothetical protein
MDYLLFIRELIITNFGVSIKSIQIRKSIFQNFILFNILRLIPFYFMKMFLNCLNIKYIYSLDNIYFSNYSKGFSLKPLFLAFELSNNEETVSIKETMKNYNLSVPFWFLINNEKLEKFNKFKIKFISNGTINTKEGLIDDYKNILIEDLFQM